MRLVETLTARLAIALAAVVAVVAIAAATTFAEPQATRSEGDETRVTAASRAVDEVSLSIVTAAGAEITEAPDPLRTPAAPDLAERTASEPSNDTQAATSVLRGEASWYGPGFAGRTTANGETYDPSGMTAAHKTLPLGTTVRVTNEHNDATVTLRINDRGPYSGGRIIDVSSAAADSLGMKGNGVVPVTVEVIG